MILASSTRATMSAKLPAMIRWSGQVARSTMATGVEAGRPAARSRSTRGVSSAISWQARERTLVWKQSYGEQKM